MSVTAAQVQALSPELARLDTPVITLALARAGRRCNADFWGALYDDAVLYLSAHLLMTEQPGASGATGGPVTSKTVGSVSVSYAAPAQSSSPYAATPYGRLYAELLASIRYKTIQAV